jgi:S1-C subfamily serine protease
MDLSAGQHTDNPPLLSGKYRSLLMMAILAGMAAAASFVVIHALRATLKDPLRTSVTTTPIKSAKPSVFGSIVTSSVPPDVKLSSPQLEKAGNRAVVTVTGYDQNDKPVSQGTGYVYSANGIIVTSFTAIRGASSVTIDTASGEELNVIALMGYSPSRDLAVLAVLEGNLPALQTGANEIVQEGDAVVVVGAGNAISKGAVGVRRAVGGVDLFQISAGGAAGSPVLNEHGKVIGMTTRKASGGDTLTLAIPSHYISDLLAEQHVISFAQMLEETAAHQ